MSGQFQCEMPPPANNFGGYGAPPANNFGAPPPANNFGGYGAPPPANNFGGYNNQAPMAAPMAAPTAGGYAAPSTAAFPQSQPQAQQRPLDTRMGQAGGRPDGPAFTGAGNPAYANVAPVAGQHFDNITPSSGPASAGAMGAGSMKPPSMNPQAMHQAAPMAGALSEANAVFQLELSGEKLARKDLFSKSDPFVQIIAPSGDIIYKSETIMNNQNPRWKTFNVSLARLGGSVNQPFTIEVYDWDKNSKNDFIGRAVTTMRDLQQQGATIALTSTGLHLQNPGRLVVHRCSRIN